jgi:hypothetical protein
MVIGRKCFGFKGFPLLETNNEDVINLPDIDNNLINNLNNEINDEITSEEIVSCVKYLKNDKASGDDFIVNEYIKSSIEIFLCYYSIVDFFYFP